MAFLSSASDGSRKWPVTWFPSFTSLPRTPLMMAVENGHIDSSVFLIRNGAMVNARDTDGRTALHRAVSGANSSGEKQHCGMILTSEVHVSNVVTPSFSVSEQDWITYIPFTEMITEGEDKL